MSAELEKQVAVLQRSLDRERKARQQAEALLERKSTEIYQSTQELKTKFDEADLKQAQLSYLTGLSADIWHVDTIIEIIQAYLRRTIEFLHKPECVLFQIEENTQALTSKFNIYSHGEVADKAEKYAKCVNIQALVQLTKEAGLESQILDSSAVGVEVSEFSYCFTLPMFDIKGSLGIACFLYRSDEIDVFKLQTVESSRAMLTLAIQRKSAATSLEKRYQELKQAYEQIDDAQKQLVQSEKMASLGQLAAGVAHEINNPVGFILSNYETLSDYLTSLDELLTLLPSLLENNKQGLARLDKVWDELDIEFIRQDIGDLLSASQGGLKRIKEIVSGLKSFSHADTKEYSPLNLNDCIEDAVQLVWNELKYNCQIDRDLADNCMIKGNVGQLQQVFVNLLVNAKQAMLEGGTICLSTRMTKHHVIVEVEDQGSGISKQDLNKLFTPFFTTKPVGVGTGLGLSISYGILQDHDAIIEVESEVGEGTKFIIKFPAFVNS